MLGKTVVESKNSPLFIKPYHSVFIETMSVIIQCVCFIFYFIFVLPHCIFLILFT